MVETKSLEQLKAERTSAKRLFSRLVNSISRTHTDMGEEELRESLNNLSLQATKVMEANEDVEAAFIMEAIKLKSASLPKFAGSKRDFHHCRKEWKALQRQGEPTGSKEVKEFQLLDSLDDKVAREFRLTAYSTAKEIFCVLENRFGNRAALCGGRVQVFHEDFKTVLLLPFDAWITTLLAGTLLRMRRKAWVLRGRKVAQKVVDRCIFCKKKGKARVCQQIMGKLSEERTRPAAPFEFIVIDFSDPTK
ncbi:uncharacterized protein LOC122145544 [Tachysurus ichikawai]